MLTLGPSFFKPILNYPAKTHVPYFGMQDSQSEDSFEPQQPKKLDKGKGLAPEVIRQRQFIAAQDSKQAAIKAMQDNTRAAIGWMKANLEGQAVELEPDVALLLAEIMSANPEKQKTNEEKRKTNIDNVFNDRSLEEGKKILEEKRKAALKSLDGDLGLIKSLTYDLDTTTMNLKAILRSAYAKCNEYLHPKEWLDHWENTLTRAAKPTKPSKMTTT